MTHSKITPVFVLTFLFFGAPLCADTDWISEPVKSSAANIADMKKVAILPFADYTQQQPYELAPEMGINQRVLEEVTDWFISHGVEVCVQEDVNGLLISEGAIVALNKRADPTTPDFELKNRHHTSVMQKDVAHMITDGRIWSMGTRGGDGGGRAEGLSAGLSSELIKKIGSQLGADKLLRGRILDYDIVKTKSLNPENGVLAVALGGFVGGLMGFANGDSYERGLPPPTIMDKDIYGNRPGLQGGGVNIPPRVKVSNVQLRLYLQDAATGKILWSNRAHVRYDADSNWNFSGNHPQRLLDSAVQSAVRALMRDLFKG